jgi:HD domain
VSYVGTLPWAERTGGAIDVRDRLELIGLAAGLAPDMAFYLADRLRKTRNPSATELSNVDTPSTPAAIAARAALCEFAPDVVIKHSLRSYLFSRLFAGAKNIDVDDELLYVACLAHDVGLCLEAEPGAAACFSIRGAQWAGRLARDNGWQDNRVNVLAEAITLNVNGRVPRRMGGEAHVMMKGVLLDATGLGAWRLPKQRVYDIFRQYSFGEQRALLASLFVSEANRHPECRGYFAKRYLAFGCLLRHAPW